MPAAKRYDAVAMALHWVMAATIIGLLVMGFVMTGLQPGSSTQFRLYQLHKSLGAVILVLALGRLAWRLGHRPPALPAGMGGAERLIAHAGHWGLYALMFGLPLAGWAVVSTSPYNIPTVLFGLVGLPHLPLPKALNGAAKAAHLTGAWLLIVLVLGHAGAALRHHFILRDDVLLRMMPRFGRQ